MTIDNIVTKEAKELTPAQERAQTQRSITVNKVVNYLKAAGESLADVVVDAAQLGQGRYDGVAVRGKELVYRQVFSYNG